MSGSPTVRPSVAPYANSLPVPPRPITKTAAHGSIHHHIHLSHHQQHQHQRKDLENDDDEHEDERASVDHAFSILSFSMHQRPSPDLVFPVSTVRGETRVVSVAVASGDSRSLDTFKVGCGEEVVTYQTGQADKEKVSWWADEEDMKMLDAGEDVYPDGGFQAWMIVFGGMLNTFSTFGYVISWGIFQSYYQQTILKDLSPSTIAWIGSIQYALGFFPAVLVGRLFDLGYFRSVFLASSFLLVMATFLVAECTVYWQFLLCQGFAFGVAIGGIFGPTIAVVSHWFKRRRGLAMGLVMMGASLGGSLIPIAAKNLIGRVGFKWTMRLFGFLLVFTLALSNLIMKRRLPPKNLPGGLLNLSAFRSPAVTIYCISAFTIFLGLYTMLTYIDVAAAGVPGVSKTLAFYLVSIANVSSLVGRYVSGVMCDRVGAMNVMIPSTMLAGVMTFIWPYVRVAHGLVAVAIVYGFCSGAYIALLSNPLIDMGDMGDVGRRIGMFMTILALGALAGRPISGAINKASGGFVAVGWYAGSMVLFGVAMMGAARWLVLRRWIGRL